MLPLSYFTTRPLNPPSLMTSRPVSPCTPTLVRSAADLQKPSILGFDGHENEGPSASEEGTSRSNAAGALRLTFAKKEQKMSETTVVYPDL